MKVVVNMSMGTWLSPVILTSADLLSKCEMWSFNCYKFVTYLLNQLMVFNWLSGQPLTIIA